MLAFDGNAVGELPVLLKGEHLVVFHGFHAQLGKQLDSVEYELAAVIFVFGLDLDHCPRRAFGHLYEMSLDVTRNEADVGMGDVENGIVDQGLRLHHRNGHLEHGTLLALQ